MKHSIPIGMALICTTICLSGCMTQYAIDRRRDAADIVTLSFGYGAGVKARVGPIQAGVFGNVDKIGLRGGEFHLPMRGYGGVRTAYKCWPGIMDYCYTIYSAESFSTPFDTLSSKREKNYGAIGLFCISIANSQRDMRKLNASYLTQFELAAGLGITARLGLNPGELFDFILGMFGVDIYRDDLGRTHSPTTDSASINSKKKSFQQPLQSGAGDSPQGVGPPEQ